MEENTTSLNTQPSSTPTTQIGSNPTQPSTTPNQPTSNPTQSTSIPNQLVKADASEVSSNPVVGTSSVWNHLTKIIPADGTRAVRCNCNYCNKELGCASEHGTSSLKRHLERCVQCPLSNKKQKILNFGAKEDSDGRAITTLLAWKFDNELSRRDLTEMIIMDELPFNCVEREGFRKFIKNLQPRFTLLSRNTVAKDCLQLYKEKKKKLKDFFKTTTQRVCLTTDMWTSIQNIGYMCLTAHFIDQDWKLQKRIINFCSLDSPHTGEVIGNTLELFLIDWGLEKLGTITVDNASNNDVAIRNLKRRFNKKNGLFLEGEFFHMRCCAHVLNLIVKEGLKCCVEVISKVRSVVRYVRGSPSRLQQFKTCCEQEKVGFNKTLVLDVPTRWNSTFLMLQTALQYQKVFESLDDRDRNFSANCKDGVPSAQDWVQAKVVANVLELFYDATVKLSGSLCVTANLYLKEIYVIESNLNNLIRTEDAMVRDMGLSMREKFNKYWGSTDMVNIILVVARVLDPRFKLKYVKFCYSRLYDNKEVDAKIVSIKNVMERLHKYYQVQESTHNATTIDSTPTSTGVSDTSDREFQQALEEEQHFHVGSELDRYLLEVVEKDTISFNILSWWKVNSSRYEILSKMARDVLAIPVSSVASESAFSTGGRILDPFRSSLTPKMVEALICTQDWLRQSPLSINNEEDLEVEDIEKIESVLKDDGSIINLI